MFQKESQLFIKLQMLVLIVAFAPLKYFKVILIIHKTYWSWVTYMKDVCLKLITLLKFMLENLYLVFVCAFFCIKFTQLIICFKVHMYIVYHKILF